MKTVILILYQQQLPFCRRGTVLLRAHPFTEPSQNPRGVVPFHRGGNREAKGAKMAEILESPTVVCARVVCLPEPVCAAVIPASHHAAEVTWHKTVKCTVCHLPSPQQHRKWTLKVHLTVESRGAFLEEVAQLVSCFSCQHSCRPSSGWACRCKLGKGASVSSGEENRRRTTGNKHIVAPPQQTCPADWLQCTGGIQEHPSSGCGWKRIVVLVQSFLGSAWEDVNGWHKMVLIQRYPWVRPLRFRIP